MICEGCGKPMYEGKLYNMRTGQSVCCSRCAERCDKVSMMAGGEWVWVPPRDAARPS